MTTYRHSVSFRLFSLVMLTAAFAATAAPFAAAREWKNKSGATVNGEFIEVIDDEGVQKVRIRKENGKTLRVKLTSLSEEDRTFVTTQPKTTQKKAKPAPVGKIKIDDNTPLDVIQEQAANGNAEAQFLLGVYYEIGEGVSQDMLKAVKWYQKAVKENQKAAEQGDAEAQNRLGVCYLNGKGVAQDKRKAFEWFQKAAKQGNAEAQYNLGVCYENGDGVAEDMQKAIEWFQKAAEQGDADAQHELGACYLLGMGVEQNKRKAVEWFQKATKQGNADSQFMLGCCYGNGWGVTQDQRKAAELIRKAAENGSQDAIDALNGIDVLNKINKR
jgi:TPR repeat protein